MSEISGPEPIAGIHHLKLFVSDLRVSLSWWEKVTGARRDPALDHRAANDEPFAYLVQRPGIAMHLELRLDPAAAKAMSTLDPITFAVETLDDLTRLGRRLDGYGIEHSPVLRGIVGWLLVTRTPDSLYVRFHTRESHQWDPENADFSSPWISPRLGQHP